MWLIQKAWQERSLLGRNSRSSRVQNGKALTDAYLVDRMSRDYPWVRKVYNFTSGYVHFSESQFFDSIHSMSGDDEREMTLQISHIDNKYAEERWVEIAACFNHLSEILLGVLGSYGANKAANQGTPTDPNAPELFGVRPTTLPTTLGC